MISAQYLLPIADELVVDLFSGGGGASTGIEKAIGRHVDIAINHDPQAISMHQANHPQTKHFVSDVFEVDPVIACGGQPVGLLWASPSCTHFSKARGSKPVSKQLRSLSWVVVKWAKAVKPRTIFCENVEEIVNWGPIARNGEPCKKRKGQTFTQWVAALRGLGYAVEWRELRASDYGAPTIRKRFFLIARCDGEPIVWPKPTHAARDALPVSSKVSKLRAKAAKTTTPLAPWRPVSECIDWSIPCPSIFERKKPLADATLRRIAKGIMKYVVNAADPFIVTNTTGHPGASVSDPLRTVTTGGHHALVVPTLVPIGYGERAGQSPRTADLQMPLGTVVGSKKHALVTAFLAKHYTGVVGSDLANPLGTVTTQDHHSLVSAHLVHMGHGEQSSNGQKRWSHGTRDIADPLNTITASGAPAAVVSSHLIKLRGTSTAQAVTDPLHTISAGGTHFAEVRAFLIAYYGSDQDTPLTDPLHTVTTRGRFGLVTIHGEDYAIVDIGLRMLSPRELFRAQGFDDSYLIDRGADGRVLTKTDQVRMCGNSVSPPCAAAIVAANFFTGSVQRRKAA